MKKTFDAYMVVTRAGNPAYRLSGSIFTSKRSAKGYVLKSDGEYVVKVRITVVGKA